jgi:hypothetical protein
MPVTAQVIEHLVVLLGRVSRTQQDLLGLLVEMGRDQGQTPHELVLWEESLALASEIRQQTQRLEVLIVQQRGRQQAPAAGRRPGERQEEQGDGGD